MKLEVERRRLLVVPETPQDEAYIEEVLGMRGDIAEARVLRVNAFNLSCLAYLEITAKKAN